MAEHHSPAVDPSKMVFRRARTDEADIAAALVSERRDWLHARGIEQWTNDPAPAVRAAVDEGVCWLLVEGDVPVATATLTADADPDFWTPEEADQPALYLSKAATRLADRGRGLGKLLIHTAAAYAASQGIPRVRWDAWRTNEALHQHYRECGAVHLRTVDAPGRFSGALFELRYDGQEAAAVDPT
ncbi:GNAT family N-acetyltransferase [Nocardioides sp. NPDC057764]|uniref:GNAT family N-acetyltransferase n=1 Tax=Nocardioides sp. NPDC057764 TaxID=3346243 RepID=UPI00366C64B4